MVRSRVEFAPLAVLPMVKDMRTGAIAESRLSTTEEQRRQALDHALEWMAEHRIWVVEVLVRWTRYEPSVLTVRGHAEHLTIPGHPERVVPDWDEVTEHNLEGVAVARTGAEDQSILEAELAEIYRTTE